MIHREHFLEIVMALAGAGCAQAAPQARAPQAIRVVAPEAAAAEEAPPEARSEPTSDVVPGPPQGVGLDPERPPESVEEQAPADLGDTCGE